MVCIWWAFAYTLVSFTFGFDSDLRICCVLLAPFCVWVCPVFRYGGVCMFGGFVGVCVCILVLCCCRW